MSKALHKNKTPSSLTMRLLFFTFIFVLIFEALIFIPALVQFRSSFLEQKIAAGTTAALSMEEVPGSQISFELEQELLSSAQIQAIIITREDSRQLILRSQMPHSLVGRFDLREGNFLSNLQETYNTINRGGVGVIQVAGASMTDRFKFVEVVILEKHLYQAMLTYSRNILGATLFLSILTAGFIFVFVRLFVVRPISLMTKSIAGFRENPEDTRQTLVASTRSDEIGIIENEICNMQEELRQALNQKTKLADLGLAVSKINHDLRNILATAQLSSERLREIKDPMVKTLTSRLISSVDRAINLCESTLKHGKAEENTPKQESINLHKLVNDVGSSLGFETKTKQTWANNVDEGFYIYADPEHMFRILLNLGQNAKQATGESGLISIFAESKTNHDTIFIEDTGGGIPKKTQQELFKPFINSGKTQGTGLGLAIARELARAHGGDLKLKSSNAEGAIFNVTLPKKNKI